MWEFAEGESSVIGSEVIPQLDKVRVGAVLEQVEDVLLRGAAVWAGVGFRVPCFRGVELSPEGA